MSASGSAWSALEITLRVAPLATLLAFIVAVPFAYLVSRREFAGKGLLTAILSLPLFLPPTAMGFILLLLLSDGGPFGALQDVLDILYTWKAAVVAAATMAFPLVFRTARVAFDGVDVRLEAMARSLGYSAQQTFFRFTLPLAARGLLAAALLGLLRSIGEFGATVMIAGNIPGRTQTLALGLFSAEQAGRDNEALVLLVVALVLGVAVSWTAEGLVRRRAGAT